MKINVNNNFWGKMNIVSKGLFLLGTMLIDLAFQLSNYKQKGKNEIL